jgi:hypothetical protein
MRPRLIPGPFVWFGRKNGLSLLVRAPRKLGKLLPRADPRASADHVIWKYALEHDFAVVTTNAQDFIGLLDVDLHPGLIVLGERGTGFISWGKTRH